MFGLGMTEILLIVIVSIVLIATAMRKRRNKQD